jgi:hypothetical protein
MYRERHHQLVWKHSGYATRYSSTTAAADRVAGVRGVLFEVLRTFRSNPSRSANERRVQNFESAILSGPALTLSALDHMDYSPVNELAPPGRIVENT